MLPNLLRGLGLGVGLMYLFDPVQGRRRRALLRDRLIKVCRRGEDWLAAAAVELRNREELPRSGDRESQAATAPDSRSSGMER